MITLFEYLNQFTQDELIAIHEVGFISSFDVLTKGAAKAVEKWGEAALQDYAEKLWDFREMSKLNVRV